MTGKYFLKSKPIRQSMLQYNGKAMRISHASPPCYVEEVIVALKSAPEKERKITTFRDKQGNILERAFDYFDQPFRNYVYATKSYIMTKDEYADVKTRKEYILDRVLQRIYKGLSEGFRSKGRPATLWDLNSLVTNIIAQNLTTEETIFSQMQVSGIDTNKEEHLFREFPSIIKNKLQHGKTKLLYFIVNQDESRIVKNSTQTENISFPTKDKYLPFRALDIETLKKPITKFFLKNRKLNDLNVKFGNFTQKPNEKLVFAYFDDEENVIRFNSSKLFKMKPKVVGIARHEVEHVWQHFLSALFLGQVSFDTEKTAKKYQILDDPQVLAEAELYTEAINNYVPYSVNYEEYKNNFLEKCASEKEIEAQREYIENRRYISKSFPHIPPEIL